MRAADVVKCGRLKPTPEHRRRALPLSRYLAALPPAPVAVDHADGVAYGLFRNDQIGDCTVAALANYFLTAAHLDGRAASFADDDVADFYYALTGGGDDGLSEIVVLDRAQSFGFPIGGDHKLAAWVRIDQGSMEAIRSCVSMFRAVYIGAELPVRAQQQDVWDTPGLDTGDDAPGSWSGHAMIVPAYDPNGVDFITWGARKRATWAWVRQYVDEAYALLDAERAAAAGVDWAALQADLAAVGTIT